ncbi:MAG TPA: hypothetical protein VGE59_00310 [Patescibacteria group bacterium]
MNKQVIFLSSLIVIILILVTISFTALVKQPSADTLTATTSSPVPNQHTAYEDCLAGDPGRASWCQLLLDRGLLSSPSPTVTVTPTPLVNASPTFSGYDGYYEDCISAGFSASDCAGLPHKFTTPTPTPSPTPSIDLTNYDGTYQDCIAAGFSASQCEHLLKSTTPTPFVSSVTPTPLPSPTPSNNFTNYDGTYEDCIAAGFPASQCDKLPHSTPSPALSYFESTLANCTGGMTSPPAKPGPMPTPPAAFNYDINAYPDINAYYAALTAYTQSLNSYNTAMTAWQQLSNANMVWQDCITEWNYEHPDAIYLSDGFHL